MSKHAAAGLILFALAAVPALADAGDADACVQLAYGLAHVSEKLPLEDAKLDRIEDLLNEMEDLCDSKRIAEAMTVAKSIEAEMNAD